MTLVAYHHCVGVDWNAIAGAVGNEAAYILVRTGDERSWITITYVPSGTKVRRPLHCIQPPNPVSSIHHSELTAAATTTNTNDTTPTHTQRTCMCAGCACIDCCRSKTRWCMLPPNPRCWRHWASSTLLASCMPTMPMSCHGRSIKEPSSPSMRTVVKKRLAWSLYVPMMIDD
jgi:hypothetical protein